MADFVSNYAASTRERVVRKSQTNGEWWMSLTSCGRGILLAFACAILLGGCAKTAPQLLADARAQEGKGDRVGAIHSLKSALQLDPNNSAMRFMLGRLHNQEFDPASAEGELLKARELGLVEGGWVSVELARALRYQGKYSELLKLVVPDQSFEKSQLASVYSLRGRAQQALEMVEDANQSLVKATAIAPDNVDVQLLNAQIDAGKRDFTGAFAIVEHILAKAPQEFDAWTYKAELLRLTGKIDDAIGAYGEVLRLNPRDFRALTVHSSLLILKGKLEEAQKDINILGLVYKGHPGAISLRGFLQFAKAHPKSALESAQAALRIAPNFADAKLLAGLSHHALGSEGQAEEFLTKYLVANPNSRFARRILGEVLMQLNRPARALEVIQPALDAKNPDPGLFALAGDAYMRTGDMAKALEWFDRSVSEDSKNAKFKVMHAVATMAAGKTEISLDELASAVALNKDASPTDEMLVLALLSRKETDRASEAVKNLEHRAPNSPLTHNLKGLVLLAKQDISGAISAFEFALKKASNFYPAASNLAQLDIAAGHPKVARQRFESILAADDKNLEAMLAIADIDLKNDDRKGATEILARAVRIAPNAFAPRQTLTAIYLAAGNKERANTMAKEALTANPDNPQAIVLAAETELASGNANKAVTTYSELLRIYPDSDRVVVQVAEFQTKAGLVKEAEERLRRLVAKRPNPPAQIALVSFLVAQQRSDDAMVFARQLQKDQPKAPIGHVLEGEVFEAIKKYPEAVAAYEAGLKLQPVGQLAFKRYQASVKGGDPKSALAQLQQWSQDHPDDQIAQTLIGDVLSVAGDYKGAAAYYELVINRVAVDKSKQIPQEVANNLAWAYYHLKDKRALGMAEAAFKASPNSGLIEDTFGWILLEQGNVALGLANLKRAVALAPEEADIRYHLAVALAKSGDAAGARTELERLLKSDKPFATRKDAESLLASLN